jgi:hypothetical protein
MKIDAEFLKRDDKNKKYFAACGRTFSLQTSYLVHPYFELPLQFEEQKSRIKNLSLKAQDQTNCTFGQKYSLYKENIDEAEILVSHVASSLKEAAVLQFMLQV